MRFTPPAVLLAALLCAACSTAAPSAPSSAPTTTAASAADVAAALSSLTHEVGIGCPQNMTGPGCTGHVALVVQRVHDLRAVMNRSASPTFFSACYVLMDKVDQYAGHEDAYNQTTALTYVIQVERWAQEHPAG